MHKPSAYKHNVPIYQTTILLTILLSPILLGAVKGAPSKSAKELSGYQQVEVSWEQRKNQWCARRSDALLLKIQKAGFGYEKYETAMANCELDFYEVHPDLLGSDNEIQQRIMERISIKAQERKDIKAECVAHLKQGYQAGKNGDPRPFNSGAFGQGHDIGSLHSFYSAEQLSVRFEKASKNCRDA